MNLTSRRVTQTQIRLSPSRTTFYLGFASLVFCLAPTPCAGEKNLFCKFTTLRDANKAKKGDPPMNRLAR